MTVWPRFEVIGRFAITGNCLPVGPFKFIPDMRINPKAGEALFFADALRLRADHIGKVHKIGLGFDEDQISPSDRGGDAPDGGRVSSPRGEA